MTQEPRVQISGSAGKMEYYCQAVRQGGGTPVADYAPAPDLSCDGLLLGGGGDLAPDLFGQENNGSDPPDLLRDQAELALFRAFFDAGKPIFGICRGMQLINVALGGTLIQDLPPEQVLFHGKGRFTVHPIRTEEGALLHRLYGQLAAVNSYHHQVVDALGDGLRATAWSESGFAEALEHESRPILGVQFHPERMAYSKRGPDMVDGAPLIEHFIALCRDGV